MNVVRVRVLTLTKSITNDKANPIKRHAYSPHVIIENLIEDLFGPSVDWTQSAMDLL